MASLGQCLKKICVLHMNPHIYPLQRKLLVIRWAKWHILWCQSVSPFSLGPWTKWLQRLCMDSTTRTLPPSLEMNWLSVTNLSIVETSTDPLIWHHFLEVQNPTRWQADYTELHPTWMPHRFILIARHIFWILISLPVERGSGSWASPSIDHRRLCPSSQHSPQCCFWSTNEFHREGNVAMGLCA